MSENHELFREYLQQALRMIEDKTGTSTAGGASGSQQGNGGRDGDQDKGILEKAKDALR